MDPKSLDAGAATTQAVAVFLVNLLGLGIVFLGILAGNLVGLVKVPCAYFVVGICIRARSAVVNFDGKVQHIS